MWIDGWINGIRVKGELKKPVTVNGGYVSHYYAPAIHPETGKTEEAQWIDNRFGPHVYGVVFPDGKVFDERKVLVPEERENK